MGMWFGPQTGPCSCCAGTPTCGCSSGSFPANVSVALSGWTDDGDCDGCDEYMGTYVLPQQAPPLDQCFWNDFGDSNPSPCDGALSHAYTSVEFSDDGTNTIITITVTYRSKGAGFNWIRYQKTFSGRVACDAFTDEAIPYDSHHQESGEDDCDYGSFDDALLTTS